jgi:hypothetical protein
MPIITISRGTFTGGKKLAGCLSELLKYPCISREVLAEAGEQYGVPEAVLKLERLNICGACAPISPSWPKTA